MKIFQILDSETRTCNSTQETVRLLKSAATRVQAKGIALATSLSSLSSEFGTPGANLPITKRGKKKQELVYEMRAEAAESAADNGGTSTTADASLRDQ